MRIQVVESKRIGILGVGEATVPTIRTMLRLLGISEPEFIAATGATFKHGILYRGWSTDPSSPDHAADTYFHPFEYLNVSDFNPPLWWLTYRAGVPGAQYASDVGTQARVAAAGRAPQGHDHAPYEGLLGYAYHLDAERLADYLAELGVQRGVERIIDDVVDVSRREDSSIASLQTRDHGTIEADFFVDCTGFAGLLLGKTLGVGFESYGDTLFCDRAVALRVPLDGDEPLRPFTTTTAKEAGWIWDIDLQARRGTGYVYSSNHTTPEQAEVALREHIGPRANKLEARHLRMRVGRTEAFWRSNVATVGLSGGFIEPLESTGIHLIEVGALRLADALQCVLGLAGDPSSDDADGQHARYLAALEGPARLYNAYMGRLYAEIRDFIKIHYSLSRRRDTAFWRDNTDPASLPDSLHELMERWEHRPPMATDFPDRFALFNEHNWLYVMLGMGWRPKQGVFQPFVPYEPGRKLMALAVRTAAKAIDLLPDHRAYFESMAAAAAETQRAAQDTRLTQELVAG